MARPTEPFKGKKFNGEMYGWTAKGITPSYKKYLRPEKLSMGCFCTVYDSDGRRYDLYNISGDYFLYDDWDFKSTTEAK